MRVRRLLCGALVATLIAGTTQWTAAFYDDTHYAFTYYMARECGYTPLQAYRMASANLSVDYARATEPVQAINELYTGAAVVAGGFGPLLREAISDRAQAPRVAFHAFRDARAPARTEATAMAEIALQEAALWKNATDMKNPGVLLHFIQDEPSHAGYASAGGHWVSAAAGAEAMLRAAPAASQRALDELARQTGTGAPQAAVPDVSLAALDLLADPTLPMGATTDFLSHRPDQTNLMIQKTVDALKRFRAAMSPRQRPSDCSAQGMYSVRDRLMRLNRMTSTASQYIGRVWPTNSTPSLPRAHTAVFASLASDVPPYEPERLKFDYNSSGQPTNTSPDDFTLYGTVITHLRRTGPLQGDVQVSVWAKPTRRGLETLHQLSCETVSGPGLEGGPIFPSKLDKLPVGDLLVRAVTSNGKVIEKSVTLNQLELEVFLDIPPPPEKTSSCGSKVAKAAAQSCSPAFTNPSPKTLDADFQKDLKEAEDCEKKEEKQKTEEQNAPTQAPTQVTPPPAGPSMGKILGLTTALVGGIVGGAYVYQQAQLLAEETDSFTTTTTTTGNPTPTSNRPSTVGLGQFSCTAANSTSNFRSCTGAINVQAGTILAARAGSSIGVQTLPSIFTGTLTAPALGGTTGTVSLRATVASCPTQTSVVFFVPVSLQQLETVSVSIPVSCP